MLCDGCTSFFHLSLEAEEELSLLWVEGEVVGVVGEADLYRGEASAFEFLGGGVVVEEVVA